MAACFPFQCLNSLRNSGTTGCTPIVEPGKKRTKRGRPCESCTLMSKKNSIESTVTGKSYNTPSANCRSKNLIYCAECLLCQKQYTGKTTNKLQKRISGHRSHVKKPPDETPKPEDTDEATLAEHLKLVHNMDSVEMFNISYMRSLCYS